MLDAIAELPSEVEDARDVYPGIHLKAAVLFDELLARRPFMCGNARIALLSAIVFLNLNGLDLRADDRDLIELTRSAEAGGMPLLAIAAAFEAASVRLSLDDVLVP